MITFAYNAAAHALVIVCTAAVEHTTKQHEDFMAAVQKLDDDGAAHGRPVSFLLVLDPGTPSPSAYWRQLYAEQRAGLKSPQAHIAIVTQSAVLRGVLTAMNWIKPDPAHVKSVHHASVQDAVTWLEQARQEPLPQLVSLYGLARANARTAVSEAG
jgi:hypothetical protein